MASYSRIEVALKMRETGIVPVFYHPDMKTCINVLKASYDGGLRVFEFTNRGDFAHEIFVELVKYAKNNLKGMIVGAGSIVDAPTAALFIQNGANFIVSPILNEEVARVCNRRKILWSPGCGSLTEISKAEELGAEIVKIFPAKEMGGPSFVKNIKGPMPWSNIMPTGGVEPNYENLSQWFKAGVWCVGMGSNLITKKAVDESDYISISKTIKEALDIVAKIRSEME